MEKFCIIYSADSKMYLKDANLYGFVWSSEWSDAYRFDTYEAAYEGKKVLDRETDDSISIIEVDVHFEW